MESKLREVPERAKPDLTALRIDRDEEKGPRSGLRAVILGTLIVVLIGGILIGYRVWSSATLPEVDVVRAMVESGGSGAEILTATGYVVAHRKAAVSPKISGRLEYLGVDVGDRVTANQVIARLEHIDLDAQLADARGSLTNWQATLDQARAELEQSRANLAQAEANREKSRLELARHTSLLAKGVTSKSDFDNVTAQSRVDEASVRSAEASIRLTQAKIDSGAAQVRSAEARLKLILAQIEYTNIRAPFNGLVISKDAEVGETVAPAIFGGTSTRGSVVTIVDPETLEVEADVNESFIGKIKIGLPAVVGLDALPNEKLAAETYVIVPTADRQKSTVKVKVRFEKVDARVLPDMSAKVTFVQKAADDQTTQSSRVTVPKSAIQTREGKTVVLVLSGDRVSVQPVTIGSELGDRLEIKQGLAGGEQVVIGGGDAINDGSKVRRKADR